MPQFTSTENGKPVVQSDSLDACPVMKYWQESNGYAFMGFVAWFLGWAIVLAGASAVMATSSLLMSFLTVMI